MKKLLPFLILTTCCLQASGQRIRLTDQTNTWRVYTDGGGTEYYSLVYNYRFSGDTVMYGNAYKTLAGTTQVIQHYQTYPTAGAYYLREDLVAGKVWMCSRTDTGERLIYNGAWHTGDTIRSVSFDTWTISSADSTQLGGQWYEVFKISGSGRNTAGRDYFDIVEGVGATAGPGFIFTGVLGLEYNYKLQCFYNNGIKPVLTPALNNLQAFSNAGPCNLAVNEPITSREAVLISNPANSRSEFTLPYLMPQGRLTIYNANGQIVSNAVVTNTAFISLPPTVTTAGLYFYRLTDGARGASFTGRFVFE